jgi:hypothetical protein
VELWVDRDCDKAGCDWSWIVKNDARQEPSLGDVGLYTRMLYVGNIMAAAGPFGGAAPLIDMSLSTQKMYERLTPQHLAEMYGEFTAPWGQGLNMLGATLLYSPLYELGREWGIGSAPIGEPLLRFSIAPAAGTSCVYLLEQVNAETVGDAQRRAGGPVSIDAPRSGYAAQARAAYMPKRRRD